MSVGNATQAVNFCTEQLTLVLGENLDQGGDDSGSRNGTGKTTIVNALSYALFGQALTNIKKDNLINKINGKNMLVTVEFEKDGKLYRIERGRKPNVLKFYIDDQVIDDQDVDDEGQGDSRETQKFVDMKQAGIIDPTKVTRTAIENAASVAGTILLTECTVVDKPEDTKQEDLNGMGGMY